MDLTLGARLRDLPGPIMVTGHTGFKGTWLTFLLERLGVPVVGFSLPPEKDSLFDRAKRTSAIVEAFQDVRNVEALTNFMKKHQPSALIHMAAQPLVLESYKKPRDTFETNVMGTVNILEVAFKTNSVRAVVVTTTDKVYRNDNLGRAFFETDPLGGKDPYSASKVGTEAAVSAWQQIAKIAGGPKVISVRAGNVIGGGDWAKDRLLPDLIRGLIAGGPIQIRNPESTRPWQHVLDPLRGYLMALEAMLGGAEFDSFNFGPDLDNLTVQQVAEIALRTWASEVKIEPQENSFTKGAEALMLSLNSQKAKKLLGWTPGWTQEEAVVSTIRWWGEVLKQGINPQLSCQNLIEITLENSNH
jgi:CDP-glucose 4,6-dehydratase